MEAYPANAASSSARGDDAVARAQHRATLRVRLPDGEVVEEIFGSCDVLATVFLRVDEFLLQSDADALEGYSLLQAFPKRVFHRDVLGSRSLGQLGLLPSATLSVLRAEDRGRVESGGVEAALYTGNIEDLSYEELLELEQRIGDGESEGKRARRSRFESLYEQRTQVHSFGIGEKSETSDPSCDGADDIRASARCSICLENYAAGSQLRALWCGHAFHKACVDQWFALREECPVCRVPLAA